VTPIKFRTLLLKSLLTLLSGFMLWRSVVLVSRFVKPPPPASIGIVLFQSVRLNFYMINIFAVCFAWPVHRLFPDSYYEAVRSKAFASVCTLLRIEQFRNLPRRTIWGARNSKRFFFNGTRRGLAQFDQNTRRAEFIHPMAFACILLASLYIGMVADPLLAAGALLVNVVWNFYPILLQRCHRSRLLAMRR
jgi:hypothetical protein